VIVGTPAADTREVKATGEGRIVQSKIAATVSMTVTALRGSLLPETWLIQPEKGSTPSLATAQMRRELATPATVVFYKFVSTLWRKRNRTTYKDQAKDAYDVHEDVSAHAKGHRIEVDKGLRSSK